MSTVELVFLSVAFAVRIVHHGPERSTRDGLSHEGAPGRSREQGQPEEDGWQT